MLDTRRSSGYGCSVVSAVHLLSLLLQDAASCREAALPVVHARPGLALVLAAQHGVAGLYQLCISSCFNLLHSYTRLQTGSTRAVKPTYNSTTQLRLSLRCISVAPMDCPSTTPDSSQTMYVRPGLNTVTPLQVLYSSASVPASTVIMFACGQT